MGGCFMQKKGLLFVLFSIILSLLLGGCLKGEQTLEELDVPEDVTIVDDDDGTEDAEDTDAEEGGELSDEEVIETEETVARELYLIDASGMVVPQLLELPKTESAAMQALEYLVKDGPVTE